MVNLACRVLVPRGLNLHGTMAVILRITANVSSHEKEIEA